MAWQRKVGLLAMVASAVALGQHLPAWAQAMAGASPGAGQGLGGLALAQALPSSSPGAAPLAMAPQDALALGVAGLAQPPLGIAGLRRTLRGWGGQLSTHLVANEGFHNPKNGSFSAFEAYEGPSPAGLMGPGDLFIGWFMGREGGAIQALEGPNAGLVVEAMAWDPERGAYSFWELIGREGRLAWHHRGHGQDLLRLAQAVPLGLGPNRYGEGLRCAGCHTLGGPVMKELEGPHNDWWRTERPLPLGGARLVPGSLPAEVFAQAADASAFRERVLAGMKRWVGERQGPARQPLPQALRSLMGAMEVNLVSDAQPNAAQAPVVAIPAAFFVDPFLAPDAAPVLLPRPAYEAALREAGVVFAPEGAKAGDADHAFLAPVRGAQDALVVRELLRSGLLDEELVADVLAVDFTRPLHSPQRASLLRFVPQATTNPAHLRASLLAAMDRARATDAAASEFLQNLMEPQRDVAFHRTRAAAFLGRLRAQAKQRPQVAARDWLRLLSVRRKEMAAAATAQNPKGTILEPGFRVVFPADRLGLRAGSLSLREADAAVVAVP